MEIPQVLLQHQQQLLVHHFHCHLILPTDGLPKRIFLHRKKMILNCLLHYMIFKQEGKISLVSKKVRVIHCVFIWHMFLHTNTHIIIIIIIFMIIIIFINIGCSVDWQVPYITAVSSCSFPWANPFFYIVFFKRLPLAFFFIFCISLPL